MAGETPPKGETRKDHPKNTKEQNVVEVTMKDNVTLQFPLERAEVAGVNGQKCSVGCTSLKRLCVQSESFCETQ